ncbi:patatin-like phospholipase domain-containing protein [Massilia endophytica]|uniref:patatin-like phospholipase family protein n=1 Tax=Massilia endophytica TaxID=2899220 RepID=UPI001E555275|nr:patatin-like phospholipase family protein [Massilia endophytica]UGQ48849.1 patatin-like phospholipase family protein [Massilia endophytica]
MKHSDYLPDECDIVMEGGVTSGVVYPSFVAELSRRFTLRSIGGTSVGAVAAVAAAAAQFKRNAAAHGGPDDGFDELARLPGWLKDPGDSGKSHLFSLFQPCADLRRHFAVVEATLNRKGPVGRVAAAVWGLLRHFPLSALAGLAAVITLHLALARLSGAADLVRALVTNPIAQISLVLWLPLGALAAAAFSFVRTAISGLSRNNGGICSGMGEEGAQHPALTEWLHQLVQKIAGLPEARPLTFGDLQESRPSIELAFMSTGLSEFRAHRLPHDSGDLLFRLSELRRLFPEGIVQAMCAASRPVADSSPKTIELLRRMDEHIEAEDRDLYFLPDAANLPIVFCARLSLSFPVLLQAIPLYRLRYVEGDGVSEGAFTLCRVWFSDGGLTSNFPIHFFDSLLPTRPTFGISLDNSLAEGAPPSARVRLPKNNAQGLTGGYADIDNSDGSVSPASFLGALIRTIRIAREEGLKHTPGYRDRIVQIMHTRKEGGLNLNMPAESIDAMSESGTEAARQIIARFLDAESSANGWLNHRWVRMRSTAALMQQKSAAIARAWNDSRQQASYASLWNDPEAVTSSYRLSPAQRAAGDKLWQHLIAAGESETDLSQGAPHPRPTLEIAPKQT